MARMARHYLPGYPYHIVQRGNNRQCCFLCDEDRIVYLDLWRKQAEKHGVKVHAYCLMTNHVHFLVTPEEEDSISETMKVVGSTYAQYINRRYERTGTLWEGRHRASLVESVRYLLACYRYIELNPVRAQLVERPEQYRWSSYHANTGADLGWLTPHAEYTALGSNRAECIEAYKRLFSQPIPEQEKRAISQAARLSRPLASSGFLTRVESEHNIHFAAPRPGRPRKEKGDGEYFH